MKNRFLFLSLFALFLAGCQGIAEQAVSMPLPVNPDMPELPFHVELGKNWHLNEDEVLYSWSYGIALEGGVLFVKEAVQGDIAALRDADAKPYLNQDGSIVSFCDSGRCLITIENHESHYWAIIKDNGLPLVRGEKSIEYIFDNLVLD